MTNQDWIELFFSESYEKQINDMILEDVDYTIPYSRLQEYVQSIIDIPFEEFLDYLKNTETVCELSASDFPNKNVFLYTDHIVDFFIQEDNRGITPEDMLQNTWYSFGKNKANATYALRSFSYLGFIYIYYDCWYLNCIGYVLGSIPEESRDSLYARLLLRKKLFRNAVISQQFDLYDEISKVGIYNSNSVYSASSFLFNFIRNEYKRNEIHCAISTKRPERDLYSIIADPKWKQFGDYLNHRIVFDLLKMAGNAPYLSDSELEQLRDNVQKGDLLSLRQLMAIGQRYVLIRSINCIGKGVPLEDLIIEAELGLYNIIKRDKYNSVSFFGQISLGIYTALQNALLHYPISLHVSFPWKKTCTYIDRQVSLFVQENHFIPKFETILDEDSIYYYGLDNVGCRNYYEIKWLEDNYSDGTFVTNAKLIEQKLDMDSFASEERYYADFDLLRKELKQILHSVLIYIAKNNIESQRDVEIVCMYFGIGCKCNYSLESIGEKYNLSRERTRQIVVRMLGAIKPYLSDEIKIENMIDNHYIVDASEYQIVEGAISRSVDIKQTDNDKKQYTTYKESIPKIFRDLSIFD